MGCCASNYDYTKEGIHCAFEQMHQGKLAGKRVLLLGAGNSGKTTLLRQLRIIYGRPWSAEEMKNDHQIMLENAIESLKSIVSNGFHTLGKQFVAPELQAKVEQLLKFEKGTCGHYKLTSKMKHTIESLWKDKLVQKAFNNRANYELCDSAEYFLNKFESLSASSYLPNVKDMFRVQAPTTQVSRQTYKIHDADCTFVDVGGQLHERKKWINCFDDVATVIFMVDISAYDQGLTANINFNRLQESLNIFELIVNSSFLANMNIILFMNKHDIFCERIITRSVRNDEKNWFTDYEGGCSEQEAFDYIKCKFLSVCRDKSKKIIVKRTRAINTRVVEHTMEELHDTL